MRGYIDGNHIGILAIVTSDAGTRGDTVMVKSCPQESSGTDMADAAIGWYSAIGRQWNVNSRVITDCVGKGHRRCGIAGWAAVASVTPACNAIMVHPETQESTGVVMTVFARQLGGEMVCRFAQNPQKLSVVTSRTIACYPVMSKALYQECGSTDMTRIAGSGSRNVTDWFGRRGDSRAGTVATRAIFGCVLENAVNVALFAL